MPTKIESKMRYHRGNSRFQQSFLSFDDQISRDNVIRVLDNICESFCANMSSEKGAKETGRKAYHPADLLKVLVYGYFNGVTSSRKLERETQRNLELKWLTSDLCPDHKTISDFRKDNLELVEGLFKYLIITFKEKGLLKGNSITVDGSKVKGNTSKEINIEAIEGRLNKIEEQVAKYLCDIDALDKAEDDVEELERKKKELERDLEILDAKKKQCQEDINFLEAIGEKRLSTTDSDARIMRGRSGSFWGYNVQAAVDTENHFITALDVTNRHNDRGLLPSVVQASEEAIGEKTQEVIADAGYYVINQLEELEQTGTQCYVAINRTPSQAKDEGHGISFTYEEQQDVYYCSEGKPLPRFSFKKRAHGKVAKVYKGTECNLCPIRSKCTSAEQRTVHRNEDQDWIDSYRQKMRSDQGQKKLRKRKSVAEHPFATIKYSMGQIPLLLRGKEKVRTEVNLYAIGYNLKRYFNLLRSENQDPSGNSEKLAA